MGYQDNLTGMNAAVMAAFGQAVTYTPKATGVADPIRAIVDYEAKDNEGGYGYEVAVITVEASDVAKPVDGDTVTIGTDVWTVRIDDAFKGDGTMWTFTATSKERRRFQ